MTMVHLSALRLIAASLLIILTTAFLRLLYILPATIRGRATSSSIKPKNGPSHIVIVLGSGGHTAEMMSLVRGIDLRRYTHRTYILSSGDSFSAGKALEIEKSIQANYTKVSAEPTRPGEQSPYTGTWDIKIVPRARKIHQPLYTAPFSSLWCLIGCLRSLHCISRTSNATPNQYPDVLITNGPATAVICIFAAYILKFLGLAPVNKMKTIYVESWARVKTLSLSGKVLLHLGICDKFLVQWETLAIAINGTGARRKAEWVGFLVD